MSENNLIIAGAGSGKTTYLVKEAISRPDLNILITTYTLSNEAAIKQELIRRNKCIPSNITIQTWFSFLLQHGVRPYQGALDDSLFSECIGGMLLVNRSSGLKYTTSRGRPVYYAEDKECRMHYFTEDGRIYSDKLSKFVVKCNEKSSNAVLDRICRIYDYVMIDEVQDLAGYDLEIVKLLMKSSSSVLLVGDPRQVVYLTHHSRKHEKYRNGGIKDFVEGIDCRGIACKIDEVALKKSHRNNRAICEYSSRLYPHFVSTDPCLCCRESKWKHEGIFLVKANDVELYTQEYDVIQLRMSVKTDVRPGIMVKSFGESKGLTFDRVLLYPTEDMTRWIEDNKSRLMDSTRARFYVALTRAKHSVGIVMDYEEGRRYDGVEKYRPECP